jgi:hypothetical protein
MVKSFLNLLLLSSLLILGACASKMKDQMQAYREAYASGKYEKAAELLNESELKKDKKSQLLWLLEKGTLSLSQNKEDEAINSFQAAVELIDQLYTKKISAKAASFLINDASDVFYGASYERSYAHYFLSKSYYSRFLKTQNKLDLQSARGTILAWDTYFTTLQRSAAPKTIYQTDLMMKIFGAEVHEVSQIRNDKQIALQLYKDAINILDSMGGAFDVFNSKSEAFIKEYEKALSEEKKPNLKAYAPTAAQEELKDFLHYKVLALTREIRNTDFNQQVKTLKPSPSVLKKVSGPQGNVVILLEEGLIPRKVANPFNFGLKGAVDSVESPAAKAFISTVGGAVLTSFAMSTLGMQPRSFKDSGSFVFAAETTRVGVNEAAISFELPMIEKSNPLKELQLVILDTQGVVLQKEKLAIISENGAIAKIVLEEDAVSRYIKTGTRVAVKHILAIIAAMHVHRKLKGNSSFIAGAAAMATYVGASKGISALEKADTRHWTTLPQAFRMMELNLPAGSYQVGISIPNEAKTEAALKILGNIQVQNSVKTIHTFKLISSN